MATDDRSGPKTPKQSGTWQMAMNRGEAARGFYERLVAAADYAAEHRHETRSSMLNGLAMICLSFAMEFELWTSGEDVGSPVRMRVSLDWLRLEKLIIRVLGDETIRTLPESVR